MSWLRVKTCKNVNLISFHFKRFKKIKYLIIQLLFYSTELGLDILITCLAFFNSIQIDYAADHIFSDKMVPIEFRSITGKSARLRLIQHHKQSSLENWNGLYC